MGVGAPRAVQRVERWLFAPVPMDAMVLARILLGFALFSCYLWRLPDRSLLYGPEGFGGGGWLHDFHVQSAHIRGFFGALDALVPFSDVILSLLYAALLLASLCFMLGYKTRLSGIVALLLHIYLLRFRDQYAYWGWSLMIQPLLAFTICSRAGRFFSIDAWLERRRSGAGRTGHGPDRGRGQDWTGPAWPMRLVQVHTCAMYLVSGGSRLDDSGWTQGNAVSVALSNTLYSKIVIDWTPFNPLLELATYGTFVLETVTPFLLWVPYAGSVVAYLSLAMHVGLEVLTNVGYWNYCMVAGLLCFLPLSHLRVLTGRLPGGPGSGNDRSSTETGDLT